MDMQQRKANRIEDFDYSQNGAYFITVCTRDRKKLLSKISVGLPDLPPTAEMLRYGEIADKYIRQMNAHYDDFSIDKYVIMPDHIHLLITIHRQEEPGKAVSAKMNSGSSVIAQFVGTFKRLCNKEYGENIWQGRYYDHVIRNQQDYNEIWEYIENNPQRWAMKKQGGD